MSTYITNLDAIKAAMPMQRALEALNISVSRDGRCKCPVHNGDDNNFQAKGEIGICYSHCGRSFDVIGLLQEMHGWTFIECIDWMVGKSGVSAEYKPGTDTAQIKEQQRTEREAIGRGTEINAIAQEYFQSLLDVQGDLGLVNLDGRDIATETMVTFAIGRAPVREGLQAFAKTHSVRPSELMELGLMKTGEHRPYEFWRQQRLIFPVRDVRGATRGFVGRIPPGQTSKAKYLNSSESKVFAKADLLFGLHENRRAIQKAGRAIIVEGQWDVVTLHDVGCKLAVASSGTALTEEQAMLLKRYADTAIVLRDADEAGIKAAARDVEILVARGFFVQVGFLPQGDDPDSFVRWSDVDPENPKADRKPIQRSVGAKKLSMFIDSSLQDGIEWLVSRDLKPKDVKSQSTGNRLAAKLLASINDEVLRDMYLGKLCGKGKPLDTGRSTIKGMIDKIRSKRVGTVKKINGDQELSITNYSLYQKSNCYFATTTPKDEGVRISNFVFKPLMLVIGYEDSHRLVEIRNIFGAAVIRPISSHDFTEFGTIKKAVESQGNFMFNEHADPKHWIRIKRLIFDNSTDAYPLPTLGWNKANFFAWANGISVEGQFFPVNDYGIVKHKERNYFLPAHSKIGDPLAESDQKDDFAEAFIYKSGAKPIECKEWEEHLNLVFADYGPIGLAYFLAAINRTVIYKRLNFFPHLNLFGAPGTGKSYLGWALKAPFGRPRQPLHIVHSTNVAFYREMAKARDAIVWFDEYSNNVPYERVEALKSAYDGVGRVKGVASTDNSTVKTAVSSAIIFSGQTQPTQDVALFERSISLSFHQKTYTQAQIDNAQELKKLEESGRLTLITQQCLSHRDLVEREIDKSLDHWNRKLKAAWPESAKPNERLFKNYSVLLATADIYSREKVIAMDVEKDLLPQCLRLAVEQASTMNEENDTGVWWDYVATGIREYTLRVDKEFKVVDPGTTLSAVDSKGDPTTVTAMVGERILALSMSPAFSIYREQLRKQNQTGGLNKKAILFYLKDQPAYLGYVKSCRIGDRVVSAHLFKLNMLPDQLGLLRADSLSEPNPDIVKAGEVVQEEGPAPKVDEDFEPAF